MHFFWLLNVVETSHPSETLVRFLCFLTALTGSNWKDFCQRSALAMRPEALTALTVHEPITNWATPRTAQVKGLKFKDGVMGQEHCRLFT